MVRRDGWSSPAEAERRGGDRIRLIGRLVHLLFSVSPAGFARCCGPAFSPLVVRSSLWSEFFAPPISMFASPEPETGCAALDYEPRASLASLWPQNSGNRTKGDIGGDGDLGFCPELCPVLCDRKFAAAWVGIGGGARPRRPGFGTPTLRSSESRWNRLPPDRVQ